MLVAFKSGIKGYLDLIDATGNPKTDDHQRLPELNLPSRIEDLRGKISKPAPPGGSKPRTAVTVGKVKSFFSNGSPSKPEIYDNNKQHHAIGNEKASKLKKMFEKAAVVTLIAHYFFLCRT